MKGKVQFTPPPPKTVDIYRNGDKIKDKYEGTSYTDQGPFVNETEYCYELVVQCPNGSSSILSNKLCEEWTNSINEIGKATFKIAPNPATSYVNISADFNFNAVEVLNFLGQIVVSQPVDDSKIDLDISTLTNGVYFIRIISENGANVQKFVKK
jgi:hypothetical protein